MSTTITLPEGWPYVAAALLSSNFLVTGQVIIVGRRRRAAGIKYPQLYAEQAEVQKSADAMRFNCAQRAHQNTLEYLPALWLNTILTATKYPLVAASLCGFWVFCRVFYTRGYITGDPSKRASAAKLNGVTLIALLGTSTYVIGKTVMAQLGL